MTTRALVTVDAIGALLFQYLLMKMNKWILSCQLKSVKKSYPVKGRFLMRIICTGLESLQARKTRGLDRKLLRRLTTRTIWRNREKFIKVEEASNNLALKEKSAVTVQTE